MLLEPLFPVEVDNIVVVLVQLISLFPSDLFARWMLQSCMAFHTVVGWGRYPWSSCPIWIPPLSIPTKLQHFGGRWTEILASESGSLRHRLFARMVCLLGYHALFLSSDIVEERHRWLCARHVCHCVSDSAPSKMDFQALPHGGAEADSFEAYLSTIIINN